VDSQPNTRPHPPRSQSCIRVLAYTTCISALGAGLLAWSLIHRLPFPSGTPLFAGLVILAELTTLEVLIPHMSLSISSAITFAALLLLGPLPAALLAMLGGLAMTVVMEVGARRRGKSASPFLQRATFNMAANGLALASGGGLYLVCGGDVAEVASAFNLLPALLAAIAVEFINSGLVVGVVSLQTCKPVLAVWRHNAWWAFPMNVLSMVVGGGGLALAYDIANLLGAAVFFLPVVLSIYAYRLYVTQTRAHLAHVEQIIAERIEAAGQSGHDARPA
jgi:hypothetical protein